VRVASGPDPPGSSRCVIERRRTPVPRVCLSVTLATPAPSGSTDTPWLRRGRLPPIPAPPGTGCPQLHRPAATGRRRRSLTSTQSTSASRRTGAMTHRRYRDGTRRKDRGSPALPPRRCVGWPAPLCSARSASLIGAACPPCVPEAPMATRIATPGHDDPVGMRPAGTGNAMENADRPDDWGGRVERSTRLAGALLLVAGVPTLAGCTDGSSDRPTLPPAATGSQQAPTPRPEPSGPEPSRPGSVVPLPVWPSESASLTTSPPDVPNEPPPTPTPRIDPALPGADD
jgi:hypothetical protein